MKTFLFTFGSVLIVLGAVWFLPGISVLPGSFMTGQKIWAIIGGICVVIGVLLICLGKSMR